MKRRLIWILLLAGLLAGCGTTLEDSRDLCCSRGTIHYRYVRYLSDEYDTFVHGMRHFLFDAAGVYLGEVFADDQAPQDLELRGLASGRYTIVTIGNMGTDTTGANTLLSKLVSGQSLLSDFRLSLYDSPGPRKNTEELFWNSISVDLTDGRRRSYIADLANIHCHLQYRVVWQDAPEFAGTYRVELSGVSEGYKLDPRLSDLDLIVNTEHDIHHTFPLHVDEQTGHRGEVELFQHKLEGEFISLRYRNDRLPRLRIFHGDQPITKPLDLGYVFGQWGWRPDTRAEQIYKIELRINRDGSVTIRPWSEATVADWQPGGTVVQ